MGQVLSLKSYPKKLSTNKWHKKIIQKSYPKYFIYINATLYKRNDATPLNIKNDNVFTVFQPNFISKKLCYATLYQRKSRKVRKVEQLCCERVIAHDVINIQDSIFWPRVESYNRSLDFCLVSTQGKIQSFVELWTQQALKD